MTNTSIDYKAISITGFIFIAVGLIFNEWTLAKLISDDGVITSVPGRVIIGIVEFLFILIGYIFLKYPSHVRERAKDVIFVTITLLLFIIMLEGGMRGFYYIKGRNVNFSEYLGWDSKENQSWTKHYEGYGDIVFSTTKYGFRIFGDLDTDKLKIFVLGDSFTQGTTVTDGYPYFEYLQKNHNNIEIFAYGAGGYGSLQEYMILDKYYDMIKPDLILWQFCPNDLINNSKELESLSLYNNNHNTRPYYNYKNGQIAMMYPKKYVGWAEKFVQHSYLLKLVSLRLGILSGEVSGSIENYLKEDDPLAVDTIKTTSAIMGMVRKRVGSIPIVSFQTDNEQIKWSGNAFSKISSEHAINYIDNVPEVLLEAKANGVAIEGPDGSHWSEAGHSIVGERILNFLKDQHLIIE